MVKNKGKTNPKLGQGKKNSRGRLSHDFLDFVKIPKRARSIHLILSPFFLILVGYGIFRGLYARYFTQDADSALFFDLLSTAGDETISSGAYGNSFWDLYALVQTGDLTPNSLRASSISSSENPLGSHAYLLSHVIHKLNIWPTDVSIFPHLILTISYTFGLAYLMYFFSTISPISLVKQSILMCLIVFSPAFYLSLQGQNYMDRIFFGPGIYVVLNLLNKSRSRHQNVFLIGLALLSFTISERVSLLLGVIIICTLLYKLNNWQSIDSALLVVGLTGVCWYFYWSSKISLSRYSGNTSLEVMKNNLLELINGTRTIPFSLFLLGNAVLLILAFFNKTTIFLAFISMAPNVFVSVGGAELNGFLTHYHSVYLPILVACAAVGFSEMRIYQEKTKVFLPISSLLIIAALCSQVFSVTPGEGRTIVERAAYSLGKVGDSLGMPISDINKSRQSDKENLLSLTSKVNIDGITTPPEIMPVLASLGFSDLNFFPIGIDQSKFVIASYLESKMDYPRDSTFGMVSDELIAKWGPELQRILSSDYRAIEEVSIGNRTYVLFEKAEAK